VVVLSNNDGCIVSRTDEAKALGIGMAGAYYEAKPLLEKHKVAVFSSNYNLYGDLSWKVMETMRMLAGADKVEVYSVDEAFIDLSHIPAADLYNVAMYIRLTIEQWTGIKVSIGVAPTKVLAKVANRLSKKNKAATKCVLVLDTPEKIQAALLKTKVEDVWGVGGRSAEKLHTMWQIDNAWQLSKMNLDTAQKYLGGVVGLRLIRELRGEPCISLKDPLEKKKMIATTRMFGKPVFALAELKEAVATYISRAAEKLRRQQCAAKTIQVFVVTNDYANQQYGYNPASKQLYTVLPTATSATNELIGYALPLVERLYTKGSRYLKAGIILSSIVPDVAIQGNLFEPEQKNNHGLLMRTIDNINFSQRNDILKFAASGVSRNWKMRQELRSGRYTSRWDELYKIV
jgi:DNA polymerase V